MEINKPNDILVATLNNPRATISDLKSSEFTPENTSLFSKDEYKRSDFIQETFKDNNGNFDNIAFDKFYELASAKYNELTNNKYIENLEETQYDPFDITRPIDSSVYKVSVEYSPEKNPFKEKYSRTGINSVAESDFSLREIAQTSDIYDTEKGEWLNTSANELGLLNKFFGKTLVYAQWDEDGVHEDPISGYSVKHKAGDWKINKEGNIFIETLGDREVYGRQVVNPTDILTADNSLINKFDFFDADNKETAVGKTAVKLAANIAPFLIPGVGQTYAAVKAAISLASVLPTFYKAFEGILTNDETSGTFKLATSAENYMAKFSTRSLSDQAQKSMFSGESIAQMTGDIFSQIYEQRAAAGLAKILNSTKAGKLTAKQEELVRKVNTKLYKDLATGKFGKGPEAIKQMEKVGKAAMNKLPEMQTFLKNQSQMSKAFSLGYMALTQAGDVYGEAINSGFDRRVAGFASLMSTASIYGVMSNNRMGDWFLDKTTGYTTGVNKATISKAAKRLFPEVKKALDLPTETAKRSALASTVKKFKANVDDLFFTPSSLGENLLKHGFIEGVEEVTEELVMDGVKGSIDALTSLGLIKQKGSFNTVENVFSEAGAERYLASLLGGLLGGTLFEFHRTRLEPWIKGQDIPKDVEHDIYQIVGNGHADLLIKEINKQRNKLGNQYISPLPGEEINPEAQPGQSQADVIADVSISIIKNVEGLMRSNDIIKTDDDIISQAMRDEVIIEDLRQAKGSSPIGIEGIIIDDFRKTASEIAYYAGEIEKYKDDPETVKRLKEEQKEFIQRKDDILSGSLNAEYFDEIMFYFNKNISNNYAVLDKITFSEAAYKKDYYSLPEEGSGLTKQRIDKEWKQYVESTNLREKLKVATSVYKQHEKDLNKVLNEYVESGYSKHRKDVYKNVLKLSELTKSFNNASAEEKEDLLNNYIIIAKQVEAETGKRLLPWDNIKTDFINQLIENKIIVGPSNQSINNYLGNNEQKRETFNQIMEAIVETYPTSVISPKMLSATFDQAIGTHNSEVQKNIDSLIAQNPNWESDEEVLDQIKALREMKLDVYLLAYSDTPAFKNKSKENRAVLLETHNNIINKQINRIKSIENWQQIPELVAEKEALESSLVNVAEISIEDFSAIRLRMAEELENYANLLGINTQEAGLVNSMPYFSAELTKVTPASSEDSLENILSSPLFNLYEKYNYDNPELITNIRNGKINKDDVVSKLNNFYALLENKKEAFEEYEEKANTLEEELNTPGDIFSLKNYALESIISEIKKGNLDQELSSVVEEEIESEINHIKDTYFKYDNLTRDEVLDIIRNGDSYVSIMAEVFQRFAEGDTFNDLLEQLPSYINTIEKVNDLAPSINDFLSEYKNADFIKELLDLTNNSFIPNTIYDYLQQYEIYLNDNKKPRKKSIFQILKEEELSLFQASDITNYLSEGVRNSDMQNAINMLRMFRSAVEAAKTSELSVDNPYGFITTRQNFVKRNELKSDILNLKTFPSDIAELASKDLERIENKLLFLKELAKQNSSKSFVEQEIIRENINKILISHWEHLSTANLAYNEKNILPNFDDLFSQDISDEEKLLKIKEAVYNHHKNTSEVDKNNIIETVLEEQYSFNNQVDELGQIDKETTDISRHFFINQFASALVLNNRDFNIKLLNMIKSDFDKAPFFTQEVALETLFASLIDPKLFSTIARGTALAETHITDYITYVLGGAGTGKSSVLFKSLVSFIKDKNPNMSVWYSAPHIEQVNALKENVEYSNNTVNLNKVDLFKALGIYNTVLEVNKESDKTDSDIVTLQDNKLHIDYEKISFEEFPNNLPDLIFIDEVTHFNALELELINEAIKKAYDKTGKLTKVVAAGDTTQKGALVKGVSYNVDRVSGVFTTPLDITIRASNVQKRVNNDVMSGLVKAVKREYESEKDLQKALSIIRGKLKFRYYIDDNTITGDLITNKISKKLLNPIKNNLSKNPEKTLGILVTQDLEEEIKGLIDELGIDENQVKYYTKDNIQGSETDYFIFNLGNINESVISHKLKAFYTYMSRAKVGSIIINDKKVEHLDIINAEADEFLEEIKPLSEEVIEEAKNAREQILTNILGGDLSLQSDFLFMSTEEDNAPDVEVEDNISTESEDSEELSTIESDDEMNITNFNYMFHTFYNDLNVNITDNGNTITLIKGDINSGLNFLFEENLNEITLNKEDFAELSEGLIKLKYDILKNISERKKNLVPKDSVIFNRIFGELYSPSKINSSLVLKKTTYSDQFNAPYAKIGDVNRKHLETGDIYLNLYLKVNKGSDSYYVHLATAPSISTISEFFKKSPNNISKFNDFLKQKEVMEIPIDFNSIKFQTSTRFEKIKNKSYNLNDLAKIPGITFWDFSGSTPKIGDKSSYNLYPRDFNEFAKLYEKMRFGKAIEEDKLKQLFEIHKGKPYIAVSFVNSANAGNSQVKFISLKSKTRSLSEIRKAASDARTALIEKRKGTVPDTLLSGGQVIDLLVDLAANKPNLFSALFEQKFLTDIISINDLNLDALEKEKWENYFKGLNNRLGQDIISHIAYESDDNPNSVLRRVIERIGEHVKNYKGDEKDFYKNIKESVVKEIKRGKEKYWFLKFWNIFSIYDRLEYLINKPNIDYELKERYKELQRVLDQIYNYWSDREFYYNVKIKPIKGSTEPIIDKLPSDLDNLYTNLTPEGPRLLIDFTSVLEGPTVQEAVEKTEDAQITEETPLEEESAIEESTAEEIVPTMSIQNFNSSFKETEGPLLKQKINELQDFVDEVTNPEEVINNILSHWPVLYDLLESDVDILNDSGEIQKTIKFKNLTEGEFNLYPKGLLKINYPGIESYLETPYGWEPTLMLETLLDSLLNHNEENGTIWIC